ncbi:MAG TPA: LuxR C-terminal-related transcriptional regulator [Fimbriimonadaceae bacterium]|nr:LuxR C-terminal-related transcriptional regulator [Fimbriimonadaceae bacterium]
MVETLSPREQRVLELAAQGLTDKGIADVLDISPTTVITYWVRIRGKLGNQPRPELVANFVRRTAEQELDALRQELQKHLDEIEALHNFIELAPEAILIVRPDGVIESGNLEASKLLNCREEDFAGLRIGRFIPPEFHEAHKGYRLKYLMDPRRLEIGHGMGVDMLTYDGRKIRGLVTINLAKSPAGDRVVVVLRALLQG